MSTSWKRFWAKNYTEHSWRIRPYRGIGRVPRDLRGVTDPKARILLDRLPSILRGYGRSLDRESSAVVVVVDSDNRDCMVFKRELIEVLEACNPQPRTLFRIAIEEAEAWLLGDRDAVKAAYPDAKDAILNGYVQDSICDTWEVLGRCRPPRREATAQAAGLPGGRGGKVRVGRKHRAALGREREPIQEFPGVSRRREASRRSRSGNPRLTTIQAPPYRSFPTLRR